MVQRGWSRRLPLSVPTLLVLTVLPSITGSAPAQPSCPGFEGYDTVAGQDADLGDLGRVAGNASVAHAACEVVPNCVGFNSRGWLKKTLTNWKNDSTICTYVRQAAAPEACPGFPGFVTRPGEDADGNDIWQPAEWSPSAAFAACDSNPWCKGFNNKGYIKHTLANWKADPVLCTYVRNDVWMMPGEAGDGQIGTGANRRNCLTIDPDDGGKGVMRECENYRDDWGHYGQHLWIRWAFHPKDPTTYDLTVYRITIQPLLKQGSFYYYGGCLTRNEQELASTVVYVKTCFSLDNGYGQPNKAAWSQEWMLKPATVSGTSGFRIYTRTSDEHCLQMGDDGDDKLYVRRCADDKRQVFAIAGDFYKE